MAPDNITLEELKANVSYNSQSGEFTRLKNTTRESVGAITGSDFVNQDGMNYTQVSVCGGRYYAHIDHNGKNNSLCNLREVSNSQNQKNRRIGKNNRSGVIGVSFYKKTSTWQAYVNVNKRLIHLGFFPLFEDAVAARKIAEREHDFHPNHGT
jgi:hypothetical protein